MGNQDEMYWPLARGAEEDLAEKAAKGQQKATEVLANAVQQLQTEADAKQQEARRPASEHMLRNCAIMMLLFVVIVSGVFLVLPHKEAAARMANVEFPARPKHAYTVPLHPRIGKSSSAAPAPFEALHFRPAHPAYAVEGAAVIHEGKAFLTAQTSADGLGVVAKKHSTARLSHIHQLPTVGSQSDGRVVSSFRTSFIFSIDFSGGSRAAVGDGLAFFMAPAGTAMGSAGENMGVLSNSASQNTFAVEFDTWKNPSLGDMSCNHVGINVNSMVSLKAANAGFWRKSQTGADRFQHFDLTRRSVRAWIDYDGESQSLSVSVSTDLESKPEKPLLRETVDLSSVLEEFMMIGFSAGSGEFAAKHVIHSWEFGGDLAGYFQSMPGSEAKEVRPHPQVWRNGPRRGMRIPRSAYEDLQATARPFPELEELTPIWMADRPRPKSGFSVIDAVKAVPGNLRESVGVGLNNFALSVASMDDSERDYFIWNSLCVLTAIVAALLFLHMLAFTSQFLLGCSWSALGLCAGGSENVEEEQQQRGYVLLVGQPGWGAEAPAGVGSGFGNGNGNGAMGAGGWPGDGGV